MTKCHGTWGWMGHPWQGFRAKCQISFGTGLSGHLRGTMSSDTPREGAGTFWELTGDSGALVLSLDKGPEGSEKWK